MLESLLPVPGLSIETAPPVVALFPWEGVVSEPKMSSLKPKPPRVAPGNCVPVSEVDGTALAGRVIVEELGRAEAESGLAGDVHRAAVTGNGAVLEDQVLELEPVDVDPGENSTAQAPSAGAPAVEAVVHAVASLESMAL